MKDSTLAFIGAGNMARSLIGGLVADGWSPHRISVADPDQEQLNRLKESFPVLVGTDNNAAAKDCNVLVLAVKPQIMKDVATHLASTVQTARPLVISIAAGIRTADLERWFGGKCALVRCMPNTPALVQSGATALLANSSVTDKQKNLAERILRAVGLTIWVDNEELLHAVTALSGSGPAYFFLLMEALQQSGVALGLPDKMAQLLAIQTAFGAAKMALESNDDPATLRHRVTSPGGTTESALKVLEEGGLMPLFEKALIAARNRSRQLAEQFGAE